MLRVLDCAAGLSAIPYADFVGLEMYGIVRDGLSC